MPEPFVRCDLTQSLRKLQAVNRHQQVMQDSLNVKLHNRHTRRHFESGQSGRDHEVSDGMGDML